MKKWVIGAIAGIGGISLAFYFFSEDNRPSGMPLSRTVIFSILKELKRELIGPLISLANLSKSIQCELRTQQITEIKRVIEDNSNIISQIKTVEKRVYSRYNTRKSEVRRALEGTFSQDQDVQAITHEIAQAIEMAYRGVIPTLENLLPTFVTHDLVLNVMKEINICTIKIAYRKVQERKAQGIKPDFRSKESVATEIEIENAVEAEKQEIFKRFGLLYLEDPASMIVHTAYEKFKKESLSFVRRLKEIENSYQENVDLIMRDQMSEEKFNRILESMV